MHTEISTITDKSSPTALLCEACQYFITQCSNYNVKMFRSKGIMFIVYVQVNCKVWVHTETSTITDKSSPTALLCEACQCFITLLCEACQLLCNTVLQLQCKNV